MRTQRYVQWVQRHTRAIFVASAALVGIAVYLAAFHLPLQTDFSSLLPGDTPSVRAAEKLAQRAPSRDTMLVVIVAPDAKSRAAAAEQAMAGVRAIGPELIELAHQLAVELDVGRAKRGVDDDHLRAAVGTDVLVARELCRCIALLRAEVVELVARCRRFVVELDEQRVRA